MKEREYNKRVNRSMFSIKSYLVFFLLISFIVTCCFLLFLNSVELDSKIIQNSAKLTFLNVLFLSLICSVIDGVRRKITIERPVKRILQATNKLTRGNFSTRIEPFHKFDSTNEMDAIIEDFNILAKELSGIETLRTDFIANVSHELKTPLAVIQNYATMLQDPSIEEKKRIEYAKTVTAATRRLSDLITNILKLNKLENQQIFSETKRYDLGEQLCECLLGFEHMWERKELDIDTDIDSNVMIEEEEELLTLVWNNLFSNAIKFTEIGGKIAVSLKERNGQAVIMVKDTGCGIRQEIGLHIFEKFYQGDTSHTIQGNGLGLALVKRVVDIVDGEITVESVVGEGSAFFVKLNISEKEAHHEE